MASQVSEGCQMPGHVVKIDSFTCQSAHCQQLNLKHCEVRPMQCLSANRVQNSLSKVEQCWYITHVKRSLVKGINQQRETF